MRGRGAPRLYYLHNAKSVVDMMEWDEVYAQEVSSEVILGILRYEVLNIRAQIGG